MEEAIAGVVALEDGDLRHALEIRGNVEPHGSIARDDGCCVKVAVEACPATGGGAYDPCVRLIRTLYLQFRPSDRLARLCRSQAS